MTLELRVLGPFEIVAGGRPVDVGGPRVRAVLARLAAAPGRTVGVGALVSELWGDDPPADAHRTVRTYVSRVRAALRRELGPAAGAVLLTRPPGYQLGADGAAVDAVRFEQRSAAGREALAAGRPEPAERQLTAALALWRGDAYAEFGDHPVLAAEAVRLDRLRLAAVEARIEAALQLGRDSHVAIELEGLVRAHPTRERLWGQLMTALYRTDRQADALAVFRSARAMLIRDYGVEPSPGLVEIHHKVLRHDASLVLA
jgi:DNA-binding SARP family transcriptional activator